ncbi:MAG: DMT family transporter [Desulfobacteraceae bacterium]|nr:DMT family transporter [Desulfobacteraceae bacterium]
MTSPSNIYKGIILILTATLGIVLMNTCVKMSSLAHDPIEMMFYRGVIALSLLVPYMLIIQKPGVFKTKRIKVQLYRAIVGNMGVGFVFWAYALLPMADVTALLFASPLFVTALSPALLKEKTDRYRWSAVIVGFGGILLIAKPSVSMLFNPASVIGLAGALCMALVDMALRNLGKTDDPLTTVFYFILVGVVISGPYTLIFGSVPDMNILPWIIGIGIFTVIQQVAKTTAFRFAEASFLAPYTYTAIVWATLSGWIFWKDFPSFPVLMGTLVVIGSNLFIVWREGRNIL